MTTMKLPQWCGLARHTHGTPDIMCSGEHNIRVYRPLRDAGFPSPLDILRIKKSIDSRETLELDSWTPENELG